MNKIKPTYLTLRRIMRSLPYLFIGLMLFSGMFSACNIVNPAESIPTYIQIDSVTLQSVVPEKHGSVSHKISDVWVYYNLQLLGAFELPAKVPVIANGKGQLQILAGIWDNGLSGTRVKYPFYTVDTFSFTAQPGKSIAYTPTFRYRTADQPIIKYFVENFEQGNSFMPLAGDTSLVRTNNLNEVFEGTWSGKMYMRDTDATAQCITSQAFSIPPSKEAYLELNYKNDVPFDVRMEVFWNGSTIRSDIISLRERSTWNKAYLRLGGFASTYQNGQFKFYIRSSLPAGRTDGTILIDNFKVIYFE